MLETYQATLQGNQIEWGSDVEVVGYHKLTEQDRQFFEVFFSEVQVLPINPFDPEN